MLDDLDRFAFLLASIFGGGVALADAFSTQFPGAKEEGFAGANLKLELEMAGVFIVTEDFKTLPFAKDVIAVD